MSDQLRIPDDLQSDYATITKSIAAGITLPWLNNHGQKRLIERIAKVEADFATLTDQCAEQAQQLFDARAEGDNLVKEVDESNKMLRIESQAARSLQAQRDAIIGVTCPDCRKGRPLFIEPETGRYTHNLGGNFCAAHYIHKIIGTTIPEEIRI